MSELRSNSEDVQKDINDAEIDIIAEIGKVEQKAREREDEKQLLAGSRCPLLGHLVQIAQVSSVCCPCDTIPTPFGDVLCYFSLLFVTSFSHFAILWGWPELFFVCFGYVCYL